MAISAFILFYLTIAVSFNFPFRSSLVFKLRQLLAPITALGLRHYWNVYCEIYDILEMQIQIRYQKGTVTRVPHPFPRIDINGIYRMMYYPELVVSYMRYVIRQLPADILKGAVSVEMICITQKREPPPVKWHQCFEKKDSPVMERMVYQFEVKGEECRAQIS